jgi:carbonic anhydrase/acetyltransferase-like protein (isoleucine patch superfamily)
MVNFLTPVFVYLFFSLPMALAVVPYFLIGSLTGKIIWLSFTPAIFSLMYVTVCGFLSRPFQQAIICGKFPRKTNHEVYGPRRLYGLCWGAIFYFYPLYYAFLSIPLLKKYLLWLFGYRGTTSFTVYADTWIRDLPLLKLSQGAYLSNKATLGTNMCFRSGFILVDYVRVAESALIGHLSMVAPGVSVGASAEIGVGTAVGIRARVQEDVKIAGHCSINHGADIGKGCDIGPASYVGVRAVLRNNLRIPAGANIPNGAILNTQADVDDYISSETTLLNELRRSLIRREGSGDTSTEAVVTPLRGTTKEIS